MVDEMTAGDALNVLEKLGAKDELGELLPGLKAVVVVLRQQIADAYLDQAKNAPSKSVLEDLIQQMKNKR